MGFDARTGDFMHRYAHVDSMRALAAILVVITHASEYGHFAIPGARVSGDWAYWWSYWLDFGRIGVVLFFGISGFVIPSSLKPGQHPLSFWVKRFFRLYPLFWFSIVAALAIQWWLPGRAFPIRDIFANVTMVPEAFGAEYVQAVYWTLSVELVFYGLCYVLFLRKIHENARILTVLAAALAILFFLYQNANVGPLTGVRSFFPRLQGEFLGPTLGHLSIMLLGALCRVYYQKPDRKLVYAITGLSLFWLVLYPVCGLVVLQTAQKTDEIVRLFFPYPIAVALFLIFLFGVKVRLPFTVWLGQVSYSLYLLHDVMVYAVGYLREKLIPGFVPGVLSYIIFCTLVAIAAAALSYRFVEKPTHELGLKLARYLDARRKLAASA